MSEKTNIPGLVYIAESDGKTLVGYTEDPVQTEKEQNCVIKAVVRMHGNVETDNAVKKLFGRNPDIKIGEACEVLRILAQIINEEYYDMEELKER